MIVSGQNTAHRASSLVVDISHTTTARLLAILFPRCSALSSSAPPSALTPREPHPQNSQRNGQRRQRVDAPGKDFPLAATRCAGSCDERTAACRGLRGPMASAPQAAIRRLRMAAACQNAREQTAFPALLARKPEPAARGARAAVVQAHLQ